MDTLPDTLPVELGIQFLILAGFRIPWAEFRVPKPGFRIPQAKKFWIPQFCSGLFAHLDYHIPPAHDMALGLKPAAKCLLIVFVNYIVFFTFLF